jgi:hypothetical protein
VSSGGDLFALESAAALLAIVRAVLDAESEPSPEGLAALLPPTADALGDVIGVAARGVDTPAPCRDSGGATR